jgi:hypothetical protein
MHLFPALPEEAFETAAETDTDNGALDGNPCVARMLLMLLA